MDTDLGSSCYRESDTCKEYKHLLSIAIDKSAGYWQKAARSEQYNKVVTTSYWKRVVAQRCISQGCTQDTKAFVICKRDCTSMI